MCVCLPSLGVVDGTRRSTSERRAVTISVHSPFSNFWRLPRAWRDPSGCCHFAFAAQKPEACEREALHLAQEPREPSRMNLLRL
ncbi:hypothetical protein CEP52_010886 [Fusarium oligoseptatum]|uniref:Uncharacterized protein n=1 Tax=Fusarium oligoseptatum TaxID=2604345 RepID=A0A428T5Y3_9HYPO|nr:hypothetical protein CEP52_010886 [Fusarium oligoseptatum]